MALIKGNHLPQEKQHGFHSLAYLGNMTLIPKHRKSETLADGRMVVAFCINSSSREQQGVKAFMGAECRGPRFPASRLEE